MKRETIEPGRRPSQRWIFAVAAAFALPLSLAGCSADQLALEDSARIQTASTGPYGALATGKPTESSAGFNPFGDNITTASGGREVIANPTLAEVMLTGPLPEMSWGRDDAPVTVVKYASLTCPICRKFHAEVFPQFKRNYIDTGKVRFIIREFPIGRSSGNATIALRCAPEAKYLDLYGRFLAQQAKWVSQEVRLDAIHAVASQVGLSRAQFDACLANQEMIAGLNWIKDRGRTLGIIGTPNFFIGNKRIKKALGYEDLAREVDEALTRPVASAG